QAEDGIRDYKVTGVQTCALPILAIGDEIVRVIDPVYHKVAEGEQPIDRRLVKVERPVVTAGGELKLQQLDLTFDGQNRYYEAPRSEERRVGKECRAVWAQERATE